MASILFFYEPPKQLDTIVHYHNKKSTSSLSKQHIEMTTSTDHELLAEWNHHIDNEGEDKYMQRLGNPPKHICEAIERDSDDPEPDVDRRADAHTRNNNAQVMAENIVQNASRMIEPIQKNLKDESSGDLISLLKTLTSNATKKNTNQPFGRDVRFFIILLDFLVCNSCTDHIVKDSSNSDLSGSEEEDAYCNDVVSQKQFPVLLIFLTF
jgi:hypothetical protein